ncbi:MAG: CHAT domain-containing protein [Cyanobacteria bacterium P01_H01_bin.15]
MLHVAGVLVGSRPWRKRGRLPLPKFLISLGFPMFRVKSLFRFCWRNSVVKFVLLTSLSCLLVFGVGSAYGTDKDPVVTLENQWAGQYGDYFGQAVAFQDLDSQGIAQDLLRLDAETSSHTAVLWLVPAPQQLTLVLITPGEPPTVVNLSQAPRSKVLKVVDEFNRALSDPSLMSTNPEAYLPAAQQLYQWLIAPIELQLGARNIDTLMTCLGGGLRSLPLAALHDGQRFLIEKYNLARIPAYNLVELDGEGLTEISVLAMGASEFTDQPSLPGVPIELDAITPTLWSGKAFLNDGFTVDNFLEERAQASHSIVHLATHAEFLPGKPSQSYIQFGDRKVTLAEIDELNWQEPPVDLLVLSACQTALGDLEAEMGFAGLTLKSGVKSAIASLWQISDVGTMALMSEFYQKLKVAPNKALALREAQISMLGNQLIVEGDELRTGRGAVPLPDSVANDMTQYDLSHPFYWASFSLIGSPW